MFYQQCYFEQALKAAVHATYLQEVVIPEMNMLHKIVQTGNETEVNYLFISKFCSVSFPDIFLPCNNSVNYSLAHAGKIKYCRL